MSLTYDPTGHPLLSEDAQDLELQDFLAQAELAEEVLKLRGVTLSGDDEAAAILAVTLQVNFQVKVPTDFGLIVSESKGDQSISYRGSPGIYQGAAPIDPTAELIVEGLLGDENWSNLRSLR